MLQAAEQCSRTGPRCLCSAKISQWRFSTHLFVHKRSLSRKASQGRAAALALQRVSGKQDGAGAEAAPPQPQQPPPEGRATPWGAF